jgi:hypothetical protein
VTPTTVTPPAGSPRARELELWLPWWVPTLVVTLGWGAAVAYAAQFGGRQFLAVVGTCVAVSAAAAAGGGLLGFLFGIPKTLQAETVAPDGSMNYRVNTNLEQISDWLTKILVGVGLTQIHQIGEVAGDVVAAVAASFDAADPAAGRALVAGLLLYFLVAGFLGGYVWTRTVLARTFTRFDAEVVLRRLDRTEERVTEAVEASTQAARDVAALAAVDDALSAAREPGDPDFQAALDSALVNASAGVRYQVYARTSGHRASTWRVDKDRMARAIPVLRALIAADVDNQYYAYYGELGFALKDSVPPGWEEAEAALSTAIAMRDGQGVEGYWWYEFNRALCRIALDPAAASGAPTAEPRRSEILADLRTARRNDRIRNLRLIENQCEAWLARNGVDPADLASA